MYPTHDADALLMLAATLATKRRPAELVEVIAAFDLLQEPVPSTGRLIDSIQRLSAHGLLCEVDGGLALSAEGQLLMAALPKRGDTAQRVFFVREKLSAHPGRAEHPSISLDTARVDAAVLAQRAQAKAPGKNLLMPKPKVDEDERRRPALRHKHPGAQRRR